MRILTALTYYRPHFSGLTIYAERLARALAARGHQVTVLTSRYDPDLPGTRAARWGADHPPARADAGQQGCADALHAVLGLEVRPPGRPGAPAPAAVGRGAGRPDRPPAGQAGGADLSLRPAPASRV